MARKQGRSAICSTMCWILAALFGVGLGYFAQHDMSLDAPIAYGSGAAGFLIAGFLFRAVFCRRRQSRVAERMEALQEADEAVETGGDAFDIGSSRPKRTPVLETGAAVEHAASEGLDARLAETADEIAGVDAAATPEVEIPAEPETAPGPDVTPEPGPEPLTLTNPIEEATQSNADRIAEVKRGVKKALQEAETAEAEPAPEPADQPVEDKADQVAAAIRAVEAEVAAEEAKEAAAQKPKKKKSVTITVQKKPAEAEAGAEAEPETDGKALPAATEDTSAEPAPQEAIVAKADDSKDGVTTRAGSDKGDAKASAATASIAPAAAQSSAKVTEEPAAKEPAKEPEVAEKPPAKSSAAEKPAQEAPKAIQPLQPKALEAPIDGKADDLTAIETLGVDQQAALYEAGIFHYSQFVSLNRREMAWIDENIPHEEGGATEWRKSAIAISRQQG